MAKRSNADVESGETPPIRTVPLPVALDQRTLPYYGEAYSTAPDAGGIFSTIGGAIGSAASAVGNTVGSAVKTVGSAVEAAKDTVLDSTVGQVALAIGTGGISLAVQGAEAAISGESNGFTRAVKGAVDDPLGTLAKLPGVALTELGAGSIVLVTEFGANVLGAATGSETIKTVGQVAGTVRETSREHPEIIAQIAISAATGNIGGVVDGIGKLAGDTAINFVGGTGEGPVPIVPASPGEFPVPASAPRDPHWLDYWEREIKFRAS